MDYENLPECITLLLLGAVALAEYIADTRSLLRLDLRENDVFVGGLMALTLAVKINETVVRIDLDKDLKKEQVGSGYIRLFCKLYTSRPECSCSNH